VDGHDVAFGSTAEVERLASSRRLRVAASVLFVALLVLGVFFRVSALGRDLVWHDEIYTQVFASGHGSADWQARFYGGQIFHAGDVQQFVHDVPERSSWDTLSALARDEPQHPPLYYLLARSWRGVFGESIAALRALSVCASVLGLALFYWLALELFRQRRVARMATVLMSVSPFFVLYAREAREYALLGAWTIGASAALLHALRLLREQAPRSRVRAAWALYVLLLTLGCYTSLSMAGVALAHGLVVLAEAWRQPSGRRRSVLQYGVGALAMSGLLFSPWLWALARHWESFRASMAWSSMIHISRPELLAHFGLSLSRPFVDLFSEPDSASVVVAIGLFSLLLGLALASCWRAAQPHARSMLAALLLVPVAMFLLPDLLFGGIRSLSARYLTAGLLSLELCVAFVLARRGRFRGARWTIAVLVIALGVGSVFVDRRREATWNKGISRALPRVAAALEGHADALLIASREQHHPGNLLALSRLIDPNTAVLFAPFTPPMEIPDAPRPIYLFSVNPLLREFVEQRTGLHARRLVHDLYAELWLLEPAGSSD